MAATSSEVLKFWLEFLFCNFFSRAALPYTKQEVETSSIVIPWPWKVSRSVVVRNDLAVHEAEFLSFQFLWKREGVCINAGSCGGA